MISFQSLPVELLYEVQLYAFSAALPVTSRRLFDVFDSAPPYFRAQYLIGQSETRTSVGGVVSKALRFPLCSTAVLDIILRVWPGSTSLPGAPDPSANEARWTLRPKPSLASHPGPELPRRWFRNLTARSENQVPFSESDQPLPFLRHIYSSSHLAASPPNADAHAGYALTRAVHAEFVSLVRFLLSHGASLGHKNSLPVFVAIRRKSLALVKLLIERKDDEDQPKGTKKRGNKRRRLEDRVAITPDMLRAAVKANARDIADYFMLEKDVVPDMQTLQILMRE